MVFLSYLPIPSLYHSINLHLAFVLATIYTAYYVLLDQFAGVRALVPKDTCMPLAAQSHPCLSFL